MLPEQKLQQVWYGERQASLALRFAAALYGQLSRLRRLMYRRGWLRSVRLPVPVLVVGNISVGGTGKTPLIIALVEALRERGWSPGVVSRGYDGSQPGPVLLNANARPAEYGDEPSLIRQRTGVPLAIGRDRPAAAMLLLDCGVDVILADDGLQHYRMARDVEICVIDGVRRFGNGRLLPAGPLREPEERLQGVDFRVCNGGNAAPGEVPMRLQGGHAQNLQKAGIRQPVVTFRGRQVHGVAGIGNPQRFFDALRGQGLDVIAHSYGDHHRFQAAELDFADELPVLMTEKDAVKCKVFAQPAWWYVPVSACLPDSFVDQLAEHLQGLRS